MALGASLPTQLPPRGREAIDLVLQEDERAARSTGEGPLKTWEPPKAFLALTCPHVMGVPEASPN